MSPAQNADTLRALSADLKPYEWQAKPQPPGAIFVQGPARQMVHKMYEGTKVAGAIEKVPPKMRGVFWMKGNGVGEELVALQFGDYSEDEMTLLSPVAPFSWGWPNGKPTDAPFGGSLFKPLFIEMDAAMILNQAGRTIRETPISTTYQFDSRPDNGTKSFARMDVILGDTRVSLLNGWGFTEFCLPMLGCLSCACAFVWPMSQRYTLEELEGENGNVALDGRAWHRGIKWGCCGAECIPFGGYTLLKVLDGEGKPVQPAYDDFIAFMGDVPIWVWAGTPESA